MHGAPGESDLYYRIIMSAEMHRLGTGLVFADLATYWIALPPLISHGSPEMIERVSYLYYCAAQFEAGSAGNRSGPA